MGFFEEDKVIIKKIRFTAELGKFFLKEFTGEENLILRGPAQDGYSGRAEILLQEEIIPRYLHLIS